jgi:hypothetical protein
MYGAIEVHMIYINETVSLFIWAAKGFLENYSLDTLLEIRPKTK